MDTTAKLHATLWKAADRLRGAMDAAQYKDFVLGLVFLRYASGDACWGTLVQQAASHPSAIGQRIDAGLDAIGRASPALHGALPRILASPAIDQGRLAELVLLIDDVPLAGGRARDLLGEVYEYFLGQFARAEGRRAGEFYTPPSVVHLLVEMLQPDHGTVYDPCCGSGGMFVQAGKFVRAHRGAGITVLGQESNERTWRLARMNLAIHEIAGNLGERPADTFRDDLHPGLAADFILANPPFNMSSWTRDPRGAWPYGTPPPGNANFGWLQHIAAKLAAGGTAGVVLANGSLSSTTSGEGKIRAAMVEDDLVACVVALPALLFRTTQIPACLWLLTRNKGPRPAELLFIDARALGTLRSRTERHLPQPHLTSIASAFHAWRQTASALEAGLEYQDVPGFCYSAALDEVREHAYILAPGHYVGSPEPLPDGELIDAKVARLTRELYASFEESARLERAVRHQLDGLDDWPGQ
jgi:type I restriction enzyme M protein